MSPTAQLECALALQASWALIPILGQVVAEAPAALAPH